jgi:hypothetical protein
LIKEESRVTRINDKHILNQLLNSIYSIIKEEYEQQEKQQAENNQQQPHSQGIYCLLLLLQLINIKLLTYVAETI